MNGVDARDFIRGTRPWSQFQNYCDLIAQERGGRFWAAQLSDPRHLDRIKEQLEAAKDKVGRPGLEGDTAVVDGLRTVANQVRLLIRVMTQSNIDFIEGPAGPADLVKSREMAAGFAIVDAALGIPLEEVS